MRCTMIFTSYTVPCVNVGALHQSMLRITMSRTIEAVLAECEDFLSRNGVTRAFDGLMILLQQGSKEDLLRLQEPIQEIIGKFLKNKKRDLTNTLQKRLGEQITVTNVEVAHQKALDHSDLREFETSLRDRLDALSKWHIFQWSTYYRDELRGVMADAVRLLNSGGDSDVVFDLIGRLVCSHSTEIFSKGYSFVSTQSWATSELSIGKSLAGLRAFLDLPVEIYADESSRISSPKDCRILRRATSRMLAGILIGFTEIKLGDISASELLQRTIKSWAPALPLLEETDFNRISNALDLERLAPLLGHPLRVLIRALDEASAKSSVDPVIVMSASVNLDDASIDMTLRPTVDSSDARPLEIAILSGKLETVRHQIEQRVKLGYIACVTEKPANMYWGGKFVPKQIADVVVPVPDGTSDAPSFLLERLRLRFYESSVVIRPSTPLRTNIAERFPLENPTLLTFFRVQRPSIRALETVLSTRTGVLLWCSVRRSGKTTGVSELANAIQEKSAVFQRCELTGIDKSSRMLFEHVCDALDELRPLPRDFLRRLVAQAAPMGVAQARGSILILDEYDRLFGRLRAAGRRNEDARHLVIQPLLDQLVEYATENLLILLGQQPNAHYIFMDQNQLSAYVQQEPYPLFSHEQGTSHGEFWELISRTFQQTLRFDPSFANAIHEETGGHPFLTVNLLRDFVDWLILRSIVPSQVTLTRSQFDEFAATRLDIRSISLCRHYEYFRSAASEALSDDGASDSPWAHATYSLVRELGLHGSGAKMAVARGAIEDKVTRVLDSVGLSGFTFESFVASAAQSNFVEVWDEMIAAKIPLLARIAAATRGVTSNRTT